MVPNDSLGRELIDVAIRTRWSEVGITVPGGVLSGVATAGAAGLQSEQNMSRSAIGWPALDRSWVTGLGSWAITGTSGAVGAGPRNLASRMAPVVVAAKYAHTITATAP